MIWVKNIRINHDQSSNPELKEVSILRYKVLALGVAHQMLEESRGTPWQWLTPLKYPDIIDSQRYTHWMTWMPSLKIPTHGMGRWKEGMSSNSTVKTENYSVGGKCITFYCEKVLKMGGKTKGYEWDDTFRLESDSPTRPFRYPSLILYYSSRQTLPRKNKIK